MGAEIVALPYAPDALEPYIDRQTMEIHHGKHYATYVANYNKAIEQAPALAQASLESVLANQCAKAPDAIKTAVRNSGGGAVNHALFWQMLKPKGGAPPSGPLGDAIRSTFGSQEQFQTAFTAAAMGRFGSGWAWLVARAGKLEVLSTANQDSPLMDGLVPILGLDVWEHAYYLKYQNRRADYVAAFWNIVNWDFVAERFRTVK
jgi:superoxide dismutase, Fe-Mn family